MIEATAVPREARLREILRRIRKHQIEVHTCSGERDSTWCFRCLRSIDAGDPYRYEVFYLKDEAVETRTHLLACQEYHTRPRLEASRARVVLSTRGRFIQELHIMSEEQLNDQEQEQEAQDEKPRRKKKKASSKKTTTQSKGKAKAKSTKAAKEKKAPKAKKEKSEDTGANSSLVSTAEKINGIEGFNNRGVAGTIKTMLKAEAPSNEDMVALRDHLKAEASRLREEGNGSAASQLSSVNRLVRRIERSTRS